MKATTLIIWLIIGIICMAFAGWITFDSYSGGASVELNTNEMKKDTDEVIRKGEELIDKASEEGEDLIDNEEDVDTTEENETDLKTDIDVETNDNTDTINEENNLISTP